MEFGKLGNSEIKVSKLCFGCWGIISDTHWGARSESRSMEVMCAALNAGINFFDTAPMYGDGASEQLLGAFLASRGMREKVVIATKIRPDQMSASAVVAECEASLQRLNTDYIDLYQTHWTNRDVGIQETWEAMLRLKEQGKVREVGVCNAGLEDLSTVGKISTPVSNQLPYSLLWRAIEFEILPECQRQEIGVLVYSPLMHGILADRFATAADVPDGRARSRHFSSERKMTRHGEPGCEEETFQVIERLRQLAEKVDLSLATLALAWIAKKQGITSIIAGASSTEQLTSNLEFLDFQLDLTVENELDKVSDGLKMMLGANADLWDAGDNARIR